ncbi:hypothetical protein LSAT2_023820 [Lamellibrachia satsuma]|nr:hypothetical protein LSAT2_023820 [Lamellibrachia satsuma]
MDTVDGAAVDSFECVVPSVHSPRETIIGQSQPLGSTGQSSIGNDTRQATTPQQSPVSDTCQPAAVNGSHRSSSSPSPAQEDARPTRRAARHQQRSGGIGVIVAQVLENITKDQKYHHYEFEVQLRKQRNKIDLATVTTQEGYNILNLCIIHGRYTFLAPLMRQDCLLRLYDVAVSLDIRSPYSGCTSRRIAEMRKSSRMVADLEFYHDWEASMKPLMKAARSGNVEEVRNHNSRVPRTAVVEAGVNVHNVNKIGESVMHVVCKMGHSNLVETLMRRRQPVDLSIKDGSDKLAVEYAAENGCIQVLQMLSIFSVHLPSSVLPLAAFNDRRQMLHYLVEECNMSVESADGLGRTALMRAVEEKRADCFVYILSRRPDLTKVDKRLRNILHYAAESGDESLTKTLLEKLNAANLLSRLIDAQDLYVIAHQSYVVRGRDRGRHAWHYVEVHRELVSVFLQKTRAGNIDVAHFGRVIKSGWGNEQEREIIKKVETYLEENGQNLIQPQDMTPLHVAIYRGNPTVAKMLLEAGANVNVVDSAGLNPLHLAAMRGDLQNACLLDERGVDFDLVSKRNKTPLDVAEDSGQDALMNFIKGRQYEILAKQFIDVSVKKNNRKVGFWHFEVFARSRRRRQAACCRFTEGSVTRHQLETERVTLQDGTTGTVEYKHARYRPCTSTERVTLQDGTTGTVEYKHARYRPCTSTERVTLQDGTTGTVEYKHARYRPCTSTERVTLQDGTTGTVEYKHARYRPCTSTERVTLQDGTTGTVEYKHARYRPCTSTERVTLQDGTTGTVEYKHARYRPCTSTERVTLQDGTTGAVEVQTRALQALYLYRAGDLTRRDYWHSRVQTRALQALYLYRAGDLIRRDYWHSRVQTRALQALYLYRAGDLTRRDYWHSRVQTRALQALYLYRAGDLIRRDYWHR